MTEGLDFIPSSTERWGKEEGKEGGRGGGKGKGKKSSSVKLGMATRVSDLSTWGGGGRRASLGYILSCDQPGLHMTLP